MEKEDREWIQDKFDDFEKLIFGMIQSKVKHMTSSPQTIDMFSMMKESFVDLKAQMKDGFDGVHQRQDKTNGNVKRNTDFRVGSMASVKTLKFLVGLVGFSNLLAIIYFLSGK